MSKGILVGAAEDQLWLDLSVGNRHGLIAGATGTGKTMSLRLLAEGFATAGVPVFMADVKGDLGGLAKPGEASARLTERADKVKTEWKAQDVPVVFWDVFGRQGHPIRATISDIGPILLGRILGLSDVQEAVLHVVFRYADDEGLLLLDLKDLRALINHVAENAADLNARYGAVASSSVGAIQRALLALENQGADKFFGEPALDIADLMMIAPDGRGAVNVLAASELMKSPQLYATFLLWLLSELFENLPEVGDLDKPKLVFFFDEAHLLFNDAPKALVTQVEQVVRLIRSKGVGIYFVTQSPLDVPETVLGQLGHRIQHALRAFTPRDQKAVRAAAETFRPNPRLDTAQAIQELGKGEALVSLLDGDGVPSIVQRVLIAPPATSLAVLSDEDRGEIIGNSPLKGVYDQAVDRESAYEKLKARTDPAPSADTGKQSAAGGWTRNSGKKAAPRQRETTTEAAVKSVARSLASSIGSSLGRQIVRGVLGAILKR